ALPTSPAPPAPPAPPGGEPEEPLNRSNILERLEKVGWSQAKLRRKWDVPRSKVLDLLREAGYPLLGERTDEVVQILKSKQPAEHDAAVSIHDLVPLLRADAQTI